jgi:hypothetical protein
MKVTVLAEVHHCWRQRVSTWVLVREQEADSSEADATLLLDGGPVTRDEVRQSMCGRARRNETLIVSACQFFTW